MLVLTEESMRDALGGDECGRDDDALWLRLPWALGLI